MILKIHNRGRVLWVILLMAMILVNPQLIGQVDAVEPYAIYTAPDGFKVVSYSKAWVDQSKLKSVYDELLKNKHGTEIKLLSRINIYPGAAVDNPTLAGRWSGSWNIIKGKPVLLSNRQIDIFKGDTLTTIDKIARTLAHEYGHHFTYYYFFQKEQKEWSQWKTTNFGAVRKLTNHPLVTSNSGDHQWMIQEIAAEDYVQLFGSPTAKKTFPFKDITENQIENQMNENYDTDIFNYQPQENYELPLAANVSGLKEYWLNAAGMSMPASKPPGQISLGLSAVKKIGSLGTPQFIFTWPPSLDDPAQTLEYTMVRFEKANGQTVRKFPVKTVRAGEMLTAVVGAAVYGQTYVWEQIPTGTGYFVIHIQDSTGLIISSQVLAVDLSNKWNPDSILIDDNSRISGNWFPPRVKIDGKQMTFDVPPTIVNGRMLVPLRGIFEELTAEVSWDDATRTVTAKRGDSIIQLKIGSAEAKVGNQVVTLEAAPVIVNGRTLVPLRFVGESLGAAVAWNNNLKVALIQQ